MPRIFVSPFIRRAILVGLLLLAHGPARAEEPQASTTSADKAFEVTLAKLVQTVLVRNLAIFAQRIEHDISKWDVAREWSAFEPMFVSSVDWSDQERRNSAEQQAATTFAGLTRGLTEFISETRSYVTGIQGHLPVGTQYTIQTTLQDVDNSLNSQDEYVAFSGVEVVQPLLKNAGIDVSMTRIRLTAVESDIVFERLRRVVTEVVSGSEGFYWDLVAAQRDYAMRSDSVRLAEQILADNRERVKVGKMSELEVHEAESQLAKRRRRQIEARQRMIDFISELRILMGELPVDIGDNIVAVDNLFAIVLPTTLDYFDRVNVAFTSNPDYLIKMRELDQDDIRLVYATNQRWPQLDLKGTYGLNGLTQTPEESIRMIASSKLESWSLGMELRLPLGGGKQSRSDLEIARLRKQQSIEELKQLELEIANRVDSLIERIGLDHKRVTALSEEVDFNNRRLKVELTLLEEGKSSSREVFRVEEDLFNAQKVQLDGLVQVRRSVLALDVVTGVLLGSRNIDLINEKPRRN